MSIIMSMMCRHLSPKTSLATGERQMYLQASIMLRIGKGILLFLRVGDSCLFLGLLEVRGGGVGDKISRGISAIYWAGTKTRVCKPLFMPLYVF